MVRKLVIAALTSMLTQPALASTACVVTTDDQPDYYEIWFIGDSASPSIAYSSANFKSGKQTALQPANYTLRRFDRESRTVDLVFRNSGDTALPPSFSLVGAGDRVRLTIGSDVIEGAFTCDGDP